MLSRTRLLQVAAISLLAALLLAAPAGAVKPRAKLKALGPVKVVKPFKGKAAKARPLASAAALYPRGGFPGALEPFCCHVPSLMGGAVGETEVVQTDAANVTVFSRTGPQRKQSNLDQFCGAESTEPRVLYDRFLKRWFFAFIADTDPQSLCILTSKTASAAGAYHVVAFQLPGAGGRSRGLRLGMDTDGLFVVFDQYSSGNAYVRSGAIAFSKAYLVRGLFPNVGFYDALPPLTPPVVVDARRPSSYFLAAGPTTTKLTVYRATAMHRGGSLSLAGEIPVPAYTGAIFATQPGTDEVLLTGNANFKTPSYQTEGLLMNAHTINRNGRPTVRWYGINIDELTIARQGRLFESGTSDDFGASVAASGDSVFFSWTSTDSRNATALDQHGPRMRFAAYKVGDASTNKVGVSAATGPVYTGAGGTESAWSPGQVSLAPQGATSKCNSGTYAFAVGPIAEDATHWRGFVKKFSTC